MNMINMRLMKNMNINMHKFEDICSDYTIDDKMVKHVLNNNNIEIVDKIYNYNDEQMNKLLKSNNDNNNNDNNNKLNNRSNSNTFNKNNDIYDLRKSKDRLFDMIYILKNGYDMYDFSKNKNEIRYDLKMEWMKKLGDNMKDMKKKMKVYKIKINDTVNEIVSVDRINIESFIVICMIENKSIILKDKYFFYVYDSDIILDNNDILVDDKNMNDMNKKYSIIDIDTLKMYKEDVTQKEIEKTYIRGNSIHKPFLSKSAYKKDDINNICKKLNINIIDTRTNKIKNKNILWEEITTKITT